MRGQRGSGKSGHRYPTRKKVIRADDPNAKWDETKASKRDRISDSPDAYLRPTKERIGKKKDKSLEE